MIEIPQIPTCQSNFTALRLAMAKAGLQQKAAPTTIPAVCIEHADDASTSIDIGDST